jgi:predicted nucleic acid-binding protein
VLAIIQRTEERRWTLLSSAPLQFELARIPDPQRRARTERLLALGQERGSVGAPERGRARRLMEAYGLRALDALRLACAESLEAEVFLTTDDGLLNASRRMPVGELPFTVANPLAWLTVILGKE